MSEEEIKELGKTIIRGSETISNILELANNALPLDRLMIENQLF